MASVTRRAVAAYQRGGWSALTTAAKRRIRGTGQPAPGDCHAADSGRPRPADAADSGQAGPANVSVAQQCDASVGQHSGASVGPDDAQVPAEEEQVPLRGDYQDKLSRALPERIALVARALPDDCRSLLDVGCNLGDFTAHFASQGIWSVGIDSVPRLVATAQARHAGVPDCALMVSELRPDNVYRLPEFDAVLLLSVHHHWLGAHGPEVAGEMLREIVQRAHRVVVFESASRRVRFGAFPPDFIDNDEESVTAYHEAYLREYVGDLVRIEPLGKTRCVGAREPYRWSWALHRVTA